jgi:hypothetical protein
MPFRFHVQGDDELTITLTGKNPDLLGAVNIQAIRYPYIEILFVAH